MTPAQRLELDTYADAHEDLVLVPTLLIRAVRDRLADPLYGSAGIPGSPFDADIHDKIAETQP